MVSASRGGELALWRLGVDVEEVARVQHHRPLVELLGGGRQVVAADDAAGVRVWPLDPGGLLRLACVAVGRDPRAEARRRMLAWPPRPLCSEG